jgi:Asp-tRNA(Asn)/Glu-tRNA(Gln) amidotransferase A subunit family amidase
MLYIDDNIYQKGAAAGPKILEGFAAPFDAEVITRLNGPTERVTLSEFGLTPPGELPSPLLCNDVFGYVRRQADKQGFSYLRPTYGTVSRHGLIQTAASMDQVGIAAKTPEEIFSILDKIAEPRKGGSLPPDTKPRIKRAADELRNDVCDAVFYILAYAEISCNLSRYDGIKFGFRAEGYNGLEQLYTKTRTEGFSIETKFAAIFGCMMLSQEYYSKYYNKALITRRLLRESLKFDEYDVLEIPPESHLAVLCGLPSLTVNGVQLMADAGNETLLRKAVEA